MMRYLFSIITAICFLLPSLSTAQNTVPKKPTPSTVKEVKGDFLIKSQLPPHPGKWSRLTRPGYTMHSEDEILLRSGTAALELCPGTEVKLEADTSLTYEETRGRIRPFTFILPEYPQKKINVKKGKIEATVSALEKCNHFILFQTPAGMIAVRGTSLAITIGEDGQVQLILRSGSAEITDPTGSFLFQVPGGTEARLNAQADGTFRIQSINGTIIGFSPESNLTIPPGSRLELVFDPQGVTSISVLPNSVNPIRVETGRVNTILNPGQSARFVLLAGGWASVESRGGGPLTVSFFQTLVRLSQGDAASFYFDPETLEIKVNAESGCPLVIKHGGEMITICAGQDTQDIAILVPGMGFLPIEVLFVGSPSNLDELNL